jgi:thiol-disulfide isomerase/thioredoxin
MRFSTLVLVILLLPISASLAADEGKPAPEMHAILFSGEKFSLTAVSGQVSIIHFWATWCDGCRLEMPVLDEYYKKHRRDGLQIVAISMDDPKNEAKAHDLMKHFSFNAAMAKDASFKSYGRIWRLPLTFVIDRKGILQKDGWVSKTGLTAENLEEVVSPLLKSNR